jgi:ribonuclease VapC
MVVDSSALVAILFDEPERDGFLRTIANANDPLVSAASLLESSIVLHAELGDDGFTDLDELVRTAGIRCVAVDEAQALAAREAWVRYGKGRRASAGLNFGDCFSYALAKTQDRPLLFKGNDFGQTDVHVAA